MEKMFTRVIGTSHYSSSTKRNQMSWTFLCNAKGESGATSRLLQITGVIVPQYWLYLYQTAACIQIKLG